MILAIAFALAAASPVQAIAHSLGDYSECLRVSAGRPDPQAAAERAQFAIAQCRSQREETIRLTIDLLAAQANATRARAAAEQALTGVEAVFPAVLAAGGGVEIPRPIAPMVRRYLDCLVEQMEVRRAMQASEAAAYGAAVESSIADCATVRASAVAEAEATLSTAGGFGEVGRRREAVSRAFDQTDSSQRNLLQMMDTIIHEQRTDASN